jgi:cytochrome c oxidase subunit 1
MRGELCATQDQLLFGDVQYYNVLITQHALLMIFWFIMPGVLGGLSNWYVPSMMGVPELAFPRINNLAVTLMPNSYLVLYGAVTSDEGAGVG